MNTTWQLTYSKLNASNRMNEKWHVKIMRLTKTSVEMFQRKLCQPMQLLLFMHPSVMFEGVVDWVPSWPPSWKNFHH